MPQHRQSLHTTGRVGLALDERQRDFQGLHRASIVPEGLIGVGGGDERVVLFERAGRAFRDLGGLCEVEGRLFKGAGLEVLEAAV